MLGTILSDCITIVLPRCCLVCNRSLHSGVLCRRCTPESTQEGSRCPRCGTSQETEEECHLCLSMPPLQRKIRSLWSYEGRAKELILAMKYRPSEALARCAGELLVEALSSLEIDPDWDFIVPMPISGESLKTRLFNQSLTIARKVAKRTATPVVSSILNHHGKHLSQTTLLHKERIRNVEGSFTVQGNILSGKRLLLIDDVLTTGATAGAATSALLTAGADSVDVITLARSHAWTEWRYRIHRSFRV